MCVSYFKHYFLITKGTQVNRYLIGGRVGKNMELRLGKIRHGSDNLHSAIRGAYACVIASGAHVGKSSGHCTVQLIVGCHQTHFHTIRHIDRSGHHQGPLDAVGGGETAELIALAHQTQPESVQGRRLLRISLRIGGITRFTPGEVAVSVGPQLYFFCTCAVVLAQHQARPPETGARYAGYLCRNAAVAAKWMLCKSQGVAVERIGVVAICARNRKCLGQCIETDRIASPALSKV